MDLSVRWALYGRAVFRANIEAKAKSEDPLFLRHPRQGERPRRSATRRFCASNRSTA